MVKKINIREALKLEDITIIDTRSPGEFELDHIPNSINIPIFDNLERKEIGTLYKTNKKQAFDLGMEHYAKKIPKIYDAFKQLEKKTTVVYCWRGGIRSKAITQLLDLLGYDTFQLEGGYKEYRKFIRESFADIKKDFVVLWGNTGVAKTKILEKLTNKLDLENLAQHRGSLFGAIGFKPRTQKQFETLLYFELKKLPKKIYVEGESRKIGNIIIPEQIYKQLLDGKHILVQSSIDSRAKNIVSEYFKTEYLKEIKSIIPKLKERLGKKIVNELLKLMDDKKHHEVAKTLLTQYYDPLYTRTLNKKNFSYTVNSDDQEACIKELEKHESIK